MLHRRHPVETDGGRAIPSQVSADEFDIDHVIIDRCFSVKTKILGATRWVRRREALTFQTKRNNAYLAALPARVLA